MNDEPVRVMTEAVLKEAEEIMVTVRSKDGTEEDRRLYVLRVEQPGTYIVARRPDDVEIMAIADPEVPTIGGDDEERM